MIAVKENSILYSPAIFATVITIYIILRDFFYSPATQRDVKCIISIPYSFSAHLITQ